MTQNLLRIGVLGAARIAPEAIIGPAKRSSGVEIAAVAARDTERARTYADKHGIRTVHNSYGALLADPSIDAIYNPLPNGLHGKWTIAAIRAGKHVLCEKPFTANAEEAREVEKVANDSDVVVMEAVHYRYHPIADRMVEIVRSGRLGRIRHVEAALAAPMPKFSDIRYRLDLAGGALMDPGCYTVHMLRTITGGEPEVVSAKAKMLKSKGVERAMRADLLFPGGVTGRIVSSLWSSDLLRLSIKVVGEKGEMSVFNPLLPQKGHRIRLRPGGIERVSRRPSYDYQLDAFRKAILEGGPVLTDAADAVRTMTVIDDIYRAAGIPVRRPSE